MAPARNGNSGIGASNWQTNPATAAIMPLHRRGPATMSMSDIAEGFIKHTEQTFGAAHPTREKVKNARRIVVKVGTAVVTRGKDQRLALGRLGALVEQLEALVRSGRQMILVSSGAVSVGRQKLRQSQILNSSPLEMQISGPATVCSRAAAAAGQSGLMALYDSLFGLMDCQAAQILVTSNDFADADFRKNLSATTEDLLSMNVVPVFNENDAISSRTAAEVGAASPFRDNDGLAALLAVELQADLLVLLTDVDGLYTGPPTAESSLMIETYCPAVHDELVKIGVNSKGGRGGMTAKMQAAWMAAQQGVTTVIANGKASDSLLQLVSGQAVGTLFDLEESRYMQERMEAEAQHQEVLNFARKHTIADLLYTMSCLDLWPVSSAHCQAPTSSRPASIRPPDPEAPQQPPNSSRELAIKARDASRTLQGLSSEARGNLLHQIADAIESSQEVILQENEKDCQEAKGKISEQLMQRLKLKPEKIKQLGAGLRSIAAQEEPVGKTLSRMEIAESLELEKVTAPIGVLLIIFEARPDALPQIAALAIRSGNGLLLKGGKEAARSNACLHKIITDTIAKEQPEVGKDVISLITTREDVDNLLKLDDVIDLVIPRGSNALVTHIQQNTKIAVLGHADGICHIYIDPDCDIDMACKICIDSKIDYPAACNAVEKVLVHEALAKDGRLFQLQTALRDANIAIYGGERSSKYLSLPKAPSPKHEYGTAALTLELVESMDDAIDHLHANGSGHTECIVTENKDTAEEFLRRVDAACVNHNSSTRFSDGFRYGLGAEVGISTARIHARGPVGVEGLLTTRFLLRGHGQTVEKDAHIHYTHKPLPLRLEDQAPVAAVAGMEQSNGSQDGAHREKPISNGQH